MIHAGRRIATVAVGFLVFAFSWLFRFNDPGGSFAGLTDDHFFYLVRGWQILYGDLPVRDFADHGAPLFYYVGAAVQQWFGRGTLSELTFTVTALSVAATLTYWLAARASGSILCGAVAALVHILLEPRFYNYPKVLVYAVAIPALWVFADRPGRWPVFWLAATTATGFLLRHDHGVFVAIGFVTLLICLRDQPARQRLRHAVLYGALVLALLAPYLVFIQVNGGLRQYVQDSSAWAARDRERAPVVWPGLFEESGDATEAGADGPSPAGPVGVVRHNFVAWMFYLELALPLFALLVIAASRNALRPDWPHAAPKLISVAVLAIVLNAGFLRSPLGARLADPSVPHAILIAWLMWAVFALVIGRGSLRSALQPWAVPVQAGLALLALPFAFVLAAGFSHNFHDRMDKAALVERPGRPFERVTQVRRQLREDWQLVSWVRRADRPDLITLALYLNECTKPTDRVFVQPYIPQVLALSRRAFAGGHADLRPGFFNNPEAQRLTLARLQQQSVPILLLETGDSYENFRKSFPLITPYLDRSYTLAATHVFDRRFGVQLFVRKDLVPVGRFELLDWPCFQ